MDKDKSEIIAKIKACFRLADPTRNPSENEAATALAMAKKLMASYRLTEAEVLIEESEAAQKIEHATPETRYHLHKYEWYIAVVCKEMFDVKPFVNVVYDANKRKRRKVLTFVGFPVDVALAGEVFRILRDDVNKMAMDCGFEEAERDAWRVGVTERLIERARQVKVQTNEKCRDLVVTKNQLIEKNIHDLFGKLKASPMRSTRLTDGRAQGRRDGDKVNLDFTNKVRHETGANKLLPR
jgi:hypothetical protein